jgi:hypothetical protein
MMLRNRLTRKHGKVNKHSFFDRIKKLTHNKRKKPIPFQLKHLNLQTQKKLMIWLKLVIAWLLVDLSEAIPALRGKFDA